MNRSRYRVTKTTRNSSCVLTEIPAPRDTRAPQHQRPQKPDHRSHTRIRKPPGNGQSGIARDAEQKENTTHEHMMRKNKCETNKLSQVLRIRKFHIYNTKFLAENQRSMPLQTKQLRLLLWPRGAKQCQFQCFAIEECASCSRSLVQWSTAICRLIQRNNNKKNSDANEHSRLRRIHSFNSPDAFLATRSRSNSTIMLKTCDMSPHRRNMFIDMACIGRSTKKRGGKLRSPFSFHQNNAKGHGPWKSKNRVIGFLPQ